MSRDNNPLGLDGFDREIQPHEYSISPVSDQVHPIRIGGQLVFGQHNQLVNWQLVGVDSCVCQRCHATIQLGPPRKLMGRWEESLGRCFYWWAQKNPPRFCAGCEELCRKGREELRRLEQT